MLEITQLQFIPWGRGSTVMTDRIPQLPYLCAGCGASTNGQILAQANFVNSENNQEYGQIFWCLCMCGHPTIMRHQIEPTEAYFQYPQPLEFGVDDKWPDHLAKLFEEASMAFSANAFTACAMVCRKMLMVVAVEHGATEGQNFFQYVEHIWKNVLTFPGAKHSIDAIRVIGNDATHDVSFVSGESARLSLKIVTYMLNTIYSLPEAHKP